MLRLKLMADAGIVGLPNAGKSTVLAATSRARPKIADYPFTTLAPNLGVILGGEREFVMADIPGLIEGAHEGRGIGTRFLGHVERTRVLLHLVDGTAEDVVKDFETVRGEMCAYGAGLVDKPFVLGLNKVDALSEEEIAEKRTALQAVAGTAPVLTLSAATGLGVQDVVHTVARFINDAASDAASNDAAS